MHYNDIFTEPWRRMGWQVIYRPSCLRRPYVDLYWNIDYPEVQWTDRTIVILHCQDFLSIHDHGCAELYNIERHYGDRSRQVVVIHWNYDLHRAYQGPLNLIYFPTHTYEILCNLRGDQFREWRHRDIPQRSRTWQCLNGIPRPHRRCVHNWLKPLTNGITCLGKIDPLPQDAYHDTYTWTGDPMINENNLVRLSWLYDHTWINVVTETQYTESPGIISEKTVFALLGRQIPIVIGYRGIVEDCRRLGFDMFDDVVNHDYDHLEDGYRWRRALELNETLLRDHRDHSDLIPRLQRQREWCLETWPSIMIRDHDRRCDEISRSLTNALDLHTSAP